MAMTPRARSAAPGGADPRRAVLEDATRVLLARPTATLAEVSAALGIGRTTLHRMFPTRTDLLRALALDALDVLEAAYGVAEGDGSVESCAAADPMARLRRLVGVMVPLGPRLRYLVVAPELLADDSYRERVQALDVPVHAAVGDARAQGCLDPALDVVWMTEVLYATVYVAWEQIDAGALAPLDAPDLVTRTWLGGVGPLR